MRSSLSARTASNMSVPRLAKASFVGAKTVNDASLSLKIPPKPACVTAAHSVEKSSVLQAISARLGKKVSEFVSIHDTCEEIEKSQTYR